MKRLALLLLASLLLAGCATRELPAPYLYTLRPMTLDGPRQKAAETGPILKLASLRGTRPYAGTRMLYTESGIDRNAFAFSRWSDSPVRLLQMVLLEQLNQCGLFRAVVPPGSTLRSDLSLEGTLLDFSLHLEGDKPRGVVETRFLLADSRSRKVLAGRRFRAEIPVEKADARHAAMALDRAARQVAGELSAWLAQQLQRH